MDDLRIALTVLSFLVFVGIAAWAYSSRRRRDFDEAAHLPFSGHDFDMHAESKVIRKEIDE